MNVFVIMILGNALLAGANISERLKFCSRSDPKLNECLKSNIQSALIALKDGLYLDNGDAYSCIVSLVDPSDDPIRISHYIVKQSPPLTFDQEYTDVAIYNASALTVKGVSAQIDDVSFSITIEGFIDTSLVVTCNYNFEKAKLGGFDVSSKGRYTLYENKKKTVLTLNGRPTKKDGMDYALITDYKMDFELEILTAIFESDNVEAAQKLTTFINDNWALLFENEEKPYAEMYGKGYRDYAQRIFDVIPYDQLFPK